jgi:hypothetical protein
MAQSVLPEIFQTSGEFQIRTLQDFLSADYADFRGIVLGNFICEIQLN